MALRTSNVVVVAAAMSSVIWMLLIMSAGAARRGADHLKIDVCPTGLVYPYWSTCFNPATYQYEGGVYQLAAAVSGFAQLAPEWDEDNATYYVRLVDSDRGAKYAFTYLTKEIRLTVSQSDDVIIQNVDSGRSLAWRQEGDDEYFLIESDDDAARFQFSIAESVSLPCPLIYTARCQAYYIVSYTNSKQGLGTYEEDGATYFKLSSNNRLPVVVMRSDDLRSSGTSSSSAVASIKMPTAAT